jgi:hypothetical protein
MNSLFGNLGVVAPLLVPLDVCPSAPDGAKPLITSVMGWVFWAVIILFWAGIVMGIGSIVAGRLFGLQHSSKIGVISLVVTVLCAILYMTLPGMLDGIVGSGCVKVPGL